MIDMKSKYLVFDKRPVNMVSRIAVINVTGFSKKEIDAKWNNLERKYPPADYSGSLIETSYSMRELES